MNTEYFKNKNIWLIGASAGIGKALAEDLADAGANVALSSRDADTLKHMMAEFLEGNHLVLPLDVTDNAAIQTAKDTILKEWPHLDMLIFNSGIGGFVTAKEMDLARTEQILDVNIHGPIRAVNAVLQHFLDRDEGQIALVASVAGYRGLPNNIGYGTSKAALIHFAESLHVDLADTNIKVQVINPGFVKTRLTDKNDFRMPFLLSTKQASSAILKGLKGSNFEISFPWFFTACLRVINHLPYRAYFWLVNKL